MRPVTIHEVTLLARVLLTLPVQDWAGTSRSILAQADGSDLVEDGISSRSPRPGKSLMSICLSLGPSAEPFADDPSLLAAMIVACQALWDHSNP